MYDNIILVRWPVAYYDIFLFKFFFSPFLHPGRNDKKRLNCLCFWIIIPKLIINLNKVQFQADYLFIY